MKQEMLTLEVKALAHDKIKLYMEQNDSKALFVCNAHGEEGFVINMNTSDVETETTLVQILCDENDGDKIETQRTILSAEWIHVKVKQEAAAGGDSEMSLDDFLGKLGLDKDDADNLKAEIEQADQSKK